MEDGGGGWQWVFAEACFLQQEPSPVHKETVTLDGQTGKRGRLSFQDEVGSTVHLLQRRGLRPEHAGMHCSRPVRGWRGPPPCSLPMH